MDKKRKPIILVVDDNSGFLQAVRMAFDSRDYSLFTALDGQEGYDCAVKQHPDVIFTDVKMPNISGLEFLHKLLSDEKTKNIPVVIVTASHFDPSTEMVFKQENNVKGFLQKPCPIDTLKDAVAEIVNK